MKKALISLMLSGVSGMAFAQTAPNLPNAVTSASGAQVAVANTGANAGIEEITVTAERRSNSVQRTSLAIQVLTNEQLEAISRPQDLTTVAPGVQIGSAGPNTQVYIRGVGDTSSTSRAQGAVAFNVDGVYFARGSTVATSFYDLQRIEVLKGPQGTLYGRNASGGAVNLLTNRPELDGISGYAEGEIGNYALESLEGAINVPLSDTLAVRGSGQVVRRDGYTSDGGQDQKTEAGRLRTLWQPNVDVSLLLNADISHIGGQGSGVVVLPVQGGNPWQSNTQQPLIFPFQYNPTTAPYSSPDPRNIDSNIWGVSAELNADLGFATLTVLPAFRGQEQRYVSYSNAFRFAEHLDDHQNSVEARLGNDSAVLKWTAGVYYYQDKFFDDVDPTQGTLTLATQFNTDIVAKAAFGQATATIFDGFRVIGGLRYTNETNSGTYTNGSGAYPLVPFSPSGPLVTYAPIQADRTNWKAGAEYDLSPTSLLFATAATGFKAGGNASTTACGGVNFKPEALTAYELGARNRFLDNSLQVNAEGFDWVYKDQQVSSLGFDNCGGVAFLTRNVGQSVIKGANIDVKWRPNPHDTLHSFVEYANGIYNKFNFTQFGSGAYAASGGSSCRATSAGGGLFNIDCSGNQLTRLPKWTAQLDYQHSFELQGGAEITSALAAQIASQRWLDISYGPVAHAPAYVVGNADITFRPPQADWSVTAFVHNMFNEAVYTSGSVVTTTALPNGQRYYAATVDAPRTFGVRARVDF